MTEGRKNIQVGYMVTRAGAVMTVCGNRVYDLPGYYLDAIIKMNKERDERRISYARVHARSMNRLRAKRKNEK